MKLADDKLGKIVQLAKMGVGGEKTAALAIVHRLCREQGLNFDDVMNADEAIHEYAFKYRDKAEKLMMVQVCYVFGQPIDGDLYENAYRKIIFIKTTAIRYVETAHVLAIYLRQYRAEKKRVLKDLPNAFIIKHRIFDDSRSSDQTYTAEELAAWRRQAELAEGMDDVQIRRAIGRGGSS